MLQIMDLVELTVIKDALVGKPGISGLSVEQRKRLTIAVELVANPSIVFMDVSTAPWPSPAVCRMSVIGSKIVMNCECNLCRSRHPASMPALLPS